MTACICIISDEIQSVMTILKCYFERLLISRTGMVINLWLLIALGDPSEGYIKHIQRLIAIPSMREALLYMSKHLTTYLPFLCE